MNDINALYSLWLKEAVLDPDLKTELESIKGNEDEILDRFYKNLVVRVYIVTKLHFSVL